MESALWTAVRALKERAAFERKLASRVQESGMPSFIKDYESRAKETEDQAALVNALILQPYQEKSVANKQKEKNAKTGL